MTIEGAPDVTTLTNVIEALTAGEAGSGDSAATAQGAPGLRQPLREAAKLGGE